MWQDYRYDKGTALVVESLSDMINSWEHVIRENQIGDNGYCEILGS